VETFPLSEITMRKMAVCIILAAFDLSYSFADILYNWIFATWNYACTFAYLCVSIFGMIVLDFIVKEIFMVTVLRRNYFID